MEYIYKKIDKKDMEHVAGTIYNFGLDAKYVLSVLNENGNGLKFCYNASTKTLSILDYKIIFKEVTIKYE